MSKNEPIELFYRFCSNSSRLITVEVARPQNQKIDQKWSSVVEPLGRTLQEEAMVDGHNAMVNSVASFVRKSVDTPTGRISYLEAGNGEKNQKTVLFLHGIAGNANSFRRQLQDLPYHVIAWDAPGYGETTLVSEPCMESYALVVRNLLDALSIEKAHAVVGHSMGGIVAQAFVGLYPNRAKKLVISSSYSGDAMPADSPLAPKWIARIQDLQNLPAEEFGAQRARGMLPETVSKSLHNEVASIASQVTVNGLKDGCALLHMADTTRFAKEFRLPVLAVIGNVDKVISPEKTRQLAALIENCQTVCMDGVAHAAYLENPDTYNAALIKFIEE